MALWETLGTEVLPRLLGFSGRRRRMRERLIGHVLELEASATSDLFAIVQARTAGDHARLQVLAEAQKDRVLAVTKLAITDSDWFIRARALEIQGRLPWLVEIYHHDLTDGEGVFIALRGRGIWTPAVEMRKRLEYLLTPWPKRRRRDKSEWKRASRKQVRKIRQLAAKLGLTEADVLKIVNEQSDAAADADGEESAGESQAPEEA